MRIAGVMRQSRKGLAVVTGNGLRGLFETDPGLPGCLRRILRDGTGLEDVRRLLSEAPELDPDTLTFLPPVQRPGKIICVGLNYADHVREVGLKAPSYPELFARFPSSLVGHNAPILRPAESTSLDFESELAIVISRAGRRIAKADALQHVAGYSIFNDATLRDFQMRTPQWTIGKNFDGTGAFGPWLVTPDELPPGARGLRITGRLNGQVMQSSNTDELIFDAATLISLISAVMTLQPGDVIITGTPGGVGFSRQPPVFMKAGDRFDVEIEGIGTLSNPIIDDA